MLRFRVVGLVFLAACPMPDPEPDPEPATISGTVSLRAGGLTAKPAAVEDAPFVPGELIVKLRAGKRASEAAGMRLDPARELAIGATLHRVDTSTSLLDPHAATLAAARALANDPAVEYAVPNYLAHTMATPNDPAVQHQWHYAAINLPAAWNVTTGSSSTTVAVIDTGILPGHPDFSGKLLPGFDFISNPSVARDGNGRDADPTDAGDLGQNPQSTYHGSHTAGTIAARTNDGLGGAGVNWSARIVPVRVLGVGGGTNVDIYEGMMWAAGVPIAGIPANPNPAKVINMSLGGEVTCTPDVQAAIDQVNARGAIIVVAAGNSNIDARGVTPAGCQGVITVGATSATTTRAPYSNYGPRIDLMAPGGDMTVDATGDSYPDGVLSSWRNDTTGQYAINFSQGTSMAAPHIAGVISLLAAVDPTITMARARQVLASTARPLSANQCNSTGCGAGLIDANAALLALGNTDPTPDPTPEPDPNDGPRGTIWVGAFTSNGFLHTQVPLSGTGAFQLVLAPSSLPNQFVLVGWGDENLSGLFDSQDFYGESTIVYVDEGDDLTNIDIEIFRVP